jgi:hypothetical protein
VVVEKGHGGRYLHTTSRKYRDVGENYTVGDFPPRISISRVIKSRRIKRTGHGSYLKKKRK